jgi:hypothetical protein
MIRLHYIKQLHDVGVVQTLQDADFPPNSPLSRRLLDLHLFVGFYGDLSIVRSKDCYSYQCICPLSNHLSHQVILLKFQCQVHPFLPQMCLVLFIRRRHASEILVVVLFQLQKL